MALKLYRRHRKECEGGHPEDSRSGEFEEGRRGWKRCSCLIHASGTLGGKFKRQQTGKVHWEEAQALVAKWETTQSWTGGLAAPRAEVAPEVPQKEETRTTITDAIAAFMSSRANRDVSLGTIKKYRTFVNQLQAYSDSRGYVTLDQLDVSDMDRFYASWKDEKRSRAKKLERLKSFIKFCRKRKWLAEDIADDLRAPAGSSSPPNKMPFTDDELDRIYKACDAIGGPKPPGPGYRPWGGEDVKDFVMLSIYTGLRISDVSTFNVAERLNGNDVFLRMHKTQKELFTWIPDWLVNRLRTREKNHGPLIFRAGQAMNMRAVSERWRDNVGKVFKLAGPFEERPTPHRFRHTFVRILLEKGVPVADVAELVGDTEDVVRRHYARWVPERQARLTKILKDAFAEKPKPKLVAMPRTARGS
jgi:integrase